MLPRALQSVIVLTYLVLAGPVRAEIPRLVSFQGQLANKSGAPLPDGPVSVTFRLYDVSTGGSALWSETKSVTVLAGRFSTALGDTVAFPSSLGWDIPYFVGVQVAADPEMTPRLPLRSAPYALGAGSMGGPSGGLSVLSFGAKGDGVTDDTQAIRSAIAAAGVNGVVVFPAGGTYLLTASLRPLEGQTFWGYGARLKRANQVVTTTTTAIGTDTSPTTLVVANASAFRVGMEITVFNGSLFDISNHDIVSVTGNQISVATRFRTAFPAGGTVVRSFNQIAGSAAGGRILGLELDGNRANNTALQKWQNHSEIRLSSDRGIIRDCFIHDAQSEGIQAGGVGIDISNNHVQDSSGNGIHLSGSTAAKVSRNVVRNANLAGTAPGHADGGIIFSNLTGDSIIVDNYVENAISGVGSIDSDDNSSVIVRGNIIRSCTSYALDMVGSNQAMGRVVFEGNLVYNSGLISLNNTSNTPTPESGVYRTNIRGNYVEGTRLFLKGVKGVVVEGNTIYSTDTANPLLTVAGSSGVQVSTNRLHGGSLGVYVDGASTRDVLVRGNTFLNQNSGAIRFQADGMINVSADGNAVTAESGAVSTGYIGIVLSNGSTADGNRLDVQAGVAGIQMAAGGTSLSGAMAMNNTVRSAAGIPSIRLSAGSQNNFVVNNFVQQPVMNAGAANNTVAPNFTIF